MATLAVAMLPTTLQLPWPILAASCCRLPQPVTLSISQTCFIRTTIKEQHVSGTNEPPLDERDWWAEGDMPVREHSRVTYLVDGRNAMLSMCRHFLAARKYIYLANWGLSADMQLVRGKDQRAGADGSREQEMLVQELRAEGLGEQEIAFWTHSELTVRNVLGYAVRKGVEVKVLLWDCSIVFSHYKPGKARDALTPVGVTCL